jgi:hypothetical protein
MHAAAIKPWGAWIPCAWPHDGLQHDKGSGQDLAAQYRAQGLNMLQERATFEDGGSGVEAGVIGMLLAFSVQFSINYRMEVHRGPDLALRRSDRPG